MLNAVDLLGPPARRAQGKRGKADTNAHVPLNVKLYLIIEAVDMRLGIEGLSRCVEQRLGRVPCAGGIYLFSNARRNRLKLLLWDGTGVWLAQRRLHRGRFTWWESPHTDQNSQDGQDSQDSQDNTHINISVETWQWLTQGIDWHRLIAKAQDHVHWRVG